MGIRSSRASNDRASEARPGARGARTSLSGTPVRQQAGRSAIEFHVEQEARLCSGTVIRCVDPFRTCVAPLTDRAGDRRSHSVPALSWGVAWPATSCFCQQTLSSMDPSARLTQPSAASQGTSVARSLSVCWYGAGSPPRHGSSPAAFCSCFRGHSLWSVPARTSLAAPRPGSEVHPPGQRPARTSLAAPRFELPDRHATRAPHAQPHPVPIRPS
jgi:hypothetical protein